MSVPDLNITRNTVGYVLIERKWLGENQTHISYYIRSVHSVLGGFHTGSLNLM